jgi:uncharacterized membrane protein YhiD involved in acid resistance
MYSYDTEFEFLFYRLLPQFLTATFCGFIVGYGREIRHKPAGRINRKTLKVLIEFWS